MASLSQGRTAAAQCGLFTYKSVPVIFEPPCTLLCFNGYISILKIFFIFRFGGGVKVETPEVDEQNLV